MRTTTDETSDDPALTDAIRAHAREVNGFVRDGMPAMMQGMMGRSGRHDGPRQKDGARRHDGTPRSTIAASARGHQRFREARHKP